jgi:hypothetical protein
MLFDLLQRDIKCGVHIHFIYKMECAMFGYNSIQIIGNTPGLRPLSIKYEYTILNTRGIIHRIHDVKK